MRSTDELEQRAGAKDVEVARIGMLGGKELGAGVETVETSRGPIELHLVDGPLAPQVLTPLEHPFMDGNEKQKQDGRGSQNREGSGRVGVLQQEKTGDPADEDEDPAQRDPVVRP